MVSNPKYITELQKDCHSVIQRDRFRVALALAYDLYHNNNNIYKVHFANYFLKALYETIYTNQISLQNSNNII